MDDFSTPLHHRPLRILIVGGGLSGLALANGLLNASIPVEVMVFERDSHEYLMERGGYQIRLAQDGITGLKDCLDEPTYAELKRRYGAGVPEAPTVIDPKTGDALIRLSRFRMYAKARAMSRRVLRAYLMRKVVAHKLIQFDKSVVGFDIIHANDGEHVKLFFEDGTYEMGDVLIAADGSKSRIAEQMGLNNRTQMHGGYHLASRGPVSDVVISKLPKVLREDGSIGFFGPGIYGFVSIYKTEDPGDINTISDIPYYQDPHLFWAVSFPGHTPARFNATGRELKLIQKLHGQELMRSKGIHPALVDILNIGDIDHMRLTTEMETSIQPPYNWRQIAQDRIGRNGGHSRVFIIGDGMHPMTPGRGMGANQALRDASALLPFLVSLAKASQYLTPEELCKLVEKTNVEFEREMFPRAFGWVNASNRSAEIDVSTRQGKFIIWMLYIFMGVVDWFLTLLEWIGFRKPNVARL
ncbi:hypothetical protein M422DRAFT_23876 [Sphaerobolus stellatus SS14]|nr:hypothetical protein M422DRAFT_23876 [Sphaerobolus stellatus SS14]